VGKGERDINEFKQKKEFLEGGGENTWPKYIPLGKPRKEHTQPNQEVLQLLQYKFFCDFYFNEQTNRATLKEHHSITDILLTGFYYFKCMVIFSTK